MLGNLPGDPVLGNLPGDPVLGNLPGDPALGNLIVGKNLVHTDIIVLLKIESFGHLLV